MHRLAIGIALVLLSTINVSATAAPLADEQERQAQIQSIEESKLAVQRMHLQLALNQLQLKRAKLEDDHRIFTLYKQSVEDAVIFTLVIVMTSAGIYMSYIQFRKSIEFANATPQSQLPTTQSLPPPQSDEEHPTAVGQLMPATGARDTSIKIDLTGIEITSSVIGLLVLAASLAFFYLYVDKVLEIREIGAPAGSHQTVGQ